MKVLRLRMFVVIGVVIALGCSKKVLNSSVIKDNADIKTISYLALGDSYTAATGINSTSGYPYQLTDRIYDEDSIMVTVNVQAKNGWTTRDLLTSLKKKIIIMRLMWCHY
jgi:hypothetical protein